MKIYRNALVCVFLVLILMSAVACDNQNQYPASSNDYQALIDENASCSSKLIVC